MRLQKHVIVKIDIRQLQIIMTEYLALNAVEGQGQSRAKVIASVLTLFHGFIQQDGISSPID